MLELPDPEEALRPIPQEDLDNLYTSVGINSLPSRDNPVYKQLRNSFSARRQYIPEHGFMLLNKEFAYELKKILRLHLTRGEFLELEAGTGIFTLLLNNLGFKGVGVTLPITEDGKHWGFKHDGKFYQMALKEHNKVLFLSNIEDYMPERVPELIIMNWVPYEKGDEIIDFFEKLHEYPRYVISTDEGEGGCVANDNYFRWLHQNYTSCHYFENYDSFWGIHDNVYLYGRR